MEFLFNFTIIVADQLMRFLITLIVARHAGVALYGDFSVAMNGLLMISAMMTLGVDSVLGYYVPKLHKQHQYREIIELIEATRSFLRPKYLLVMGGSILIIIVSFILSSIWSSMTIIEITHPVYLFLWGTMAICLYNIYIQFFRSVGLVRLSVLLTLLQTVSFLIFSLLISFWLYPFFFGSNIDYFPHIMLIGFILSYIIIEIISFIYKHKRMGPFKGHTVVNLPSDWKSKIFGYTLQNLNRYIHSTLVLLVMEVVSNDEMSTGLFAAAMSIIGLASIFLYPMSTLIGTEISASFTGDKKTFKNLMRRDIILCGGIGIIVAVLIGLFARQLLNLFQAEFIVALPYVYASLIAVITWGFSAPLLKMIQYSPNGHVLGAKMTMSLFIVQLISSVFFTYFWAALGGIICYVGINVLILISAIYYANKVYKEEFEDKKIPA